MIFFNFFYAFLISSVGSLLASKKSKNIILLWEKYCNYPLTTTLGDRFASCESIVSRSQTSSLPPPLPPAPAACSSSFKTSSTKSSLFNCFLFDNFDLSSAFSCFKASRRVRQFYWLKPLDLRKESPFQFLCR